MRILSACLLALSLFSVRAPAQDPRGYRGRWNDWAHEPMTLARGAWRVTVQAVATSDNDFKIAAADWSYEWTHDGLLPLGEVRTAYPVGENTEMEAVPGRRYAFAMDDVNYSVEGHMLVQETENEPVEIVSVSHALGDSNAVATLTTSAAPVAGENIFVRYTFDNWISSAFAEAAGADTNWTAEIPHAPENAGHTCAFYALSTTVAAPTHAAADLQTLRWNDNAGGAYSYVVPGEAPPGRLYINEVLSSNDSSEQDEDGEYWDWVEIWNAGAGPVDLAGWGLSDSDSNPFKWTFGAVTIQPGEFLVVWASSKNRPAVTNGNQLHTSFAISAGGEEIVLTAPGG
ncbi:MAG: lamin tail domain-containing protein, partial [Opitutae bacterium]|nr:lamin tail domain-containing protein [Opitutae bacterium]